jgi:hypothetical protein
MNEKIKNRLEVEINKSYYAHKRYKVDTTFALLYHEKELSVEQLGKFVRISDHLLKIDEHHYFINFVHTHHDAAFKASENLIYALDRYFNDQKSLIALDTFNITQTPNLVIHRLFQILKEIEKNPYSRIDDENILNDLI